MEQIQKIEKLLSKEGISYQLASYDPIVKSAEEASEQIGIPVERMIKSLIIKTKEKFAMFLIPSPKKIDIEKANTVLNSKLTMASPVEVLEITGYKIGTVTPFFLKTNIEIFIDFSVNCFDRVGIASGVRGTEIILNPKELKKAVGADLADVV